LPGNKLNNRSKGREKMAAEIKVKSPRTIRIIAVEKGIGMTEAEVRGFLSKSRFVLKLGTVDAKGDPYIHPVWYLFEPKGSKLYVFTGKDSKKLRNIKGRSVVYFEVDDVTWPYKGVKGKGLAKRVIGRKKTVAIVDKILTKYIKKRKELIFSGHMEGARNGDYAVIEIRPMYFSTWDYGKLEAKYRNAVLI
jgi:nitroimidazol reductase NimA-like FMN-containing flavoprotein (pyridoxamine 5'-phosphate oxidase superfamily)